MRDEKSSLAEALESAAGLETEMLALARARAALGPPLMAVQAWEIARRLYRALLMSGS